MASIFDSLLNDPDDKTQQQAMVNALRRQQDFGTLGQLMGLEPTMQAGQSMQKQAQQSFAEAMQAQSQARAERIRKMEREQSQENWQMDYNLSKERLEHGDDETNDYRRYRDENALRTQFEKLTGDLNEELRSVGMIKQLASLGRPPTAAEQQSIIILLNKFQDPTSVVREGEFDRVVRAQGLENQAKNLYDRIFKGEPIGPDMVRDIGVLANIYEQAALSRGQRIGKQYWELGTRRGHDPASIVTDARWQPMPPAPAAAPPAGSVRPRPRPAPAAAPAPAGGAPAQPGAGYGPPPPGAVRPRKRG